MTQNVVNVLGNHTHLLVPHMEGGQPNRKASSHSSGGWESHIKVSEKLVPSQDPEGRIQVSLPDLEMPIFSLCLFSLCSLCACLSVSMFPHFIRILVTLEQGLPKCPHFNLISLIKTLTPKSCQSEVMGLQHTILELHDSICNNNYRDP